MSYREHCRRVAREDWHHDRLFWAILAPHMPSGKRSEPPPLPDILKDEVSANGHR